MQIYHVTQFLKKFDNQLDSNFNSQEISNKCIPFIHCVHKLYFMYDMTPTPEAFHNK